MKKGENLMKPVVIDHEKVKANAFAALKLIQKFDAIWAAEFDTEEMYGDTTLKELCSTTDILFLWPEIAIQASVAIDLVVGVATIEIMVLESSNITKLVLGELEDALIHSFGKEGIIPYYENNRLKAKFLL